MSYFEKKCFAPHEILKWNWFVQNRLWWMFCFQKVTFWILLAHENAHFCSYAFSQKPPIGEKNGRKKTVSYQNFWKESDFETSFQQRVRIWIKNFRISQIFSQLYATRHFSNRSFYSVSDYETSFLPHVRFWTETSTTQQIFTWNSFWKTNISWATRFQKI